MAVQRQTPTLVGNRLRRDVLTLAWPAILEMVLLMAVGIIDTAMVGRLGPTALAAVGLSNQLFMFGTAIFAAIATGATAIVARHVGAEEPDTAGDVARQSLLLGFFVAGSVMLILYFGNRQILEFLFRQSEQEVLLLGATYTRIVSLSLVFGLFMLMINGTLRGAGDTRTPLRLTGIVNTLNVLGNYVLIFGVGPFPQLGVAGAAIATSTAYSIGGVLAVWTLLRVPSIHVSLSGPYRFDPTIIRRILNIGIPAAAEQGAMRLGQLFYTMIVASLGTVAYASHQVALVAESLSYMPGWGFGLAATTLVGQNLGANKPEQAQQSGFIANQMAMVIMSVMGVIFFAFPEPLVRLFTPDQEVIALASVCLRLIAFSQPALATLMVLSGGLRGAGDTRTVFRITAVGFCGVRLALAYILVVVLGYGLIGAWVAMSADLFLRGILYRIHFGRGRWKTLKV